MSAKLHIFGAKWQANRIGSTIAPFASVSARNISPNDERSSWVITGDLTDLMAVSQAVLKADHEQQLFINMALLNGENLVSTWAVGWNKK